MSELDTFIRLLIFLLIVFLYLHITAQWKTSEDLEIYEADFVNNTQIQEICNAKQPVLFLMNILPSFYTKTQKAFLAKHDYVDVKVKDTMDYWNPATTTVEEIILPFHNAKSLTETDTQQRYVSENNRGFIEYSGLDRVFGEMDAHLRPPFTVATKHDLCFGSAGASTPFRYHTHSRMFLAVSSGKIHVKMAPWKCRKYLFPTKDWDALEFRSPINPWKPQPKYRAEYEKVRCLEFDVLPEYVLYIPPYWWYSIQYSSDTSTVATSFVYNTAMNALANSYDWTVHYMRWSGWTGGMGSDADRGLMLTEKGETIKPDETKTNTDGIEIELGQREDIPLPPPEKKQIITNSGVYST